MTQSHSSRAASGNTGPTVLGFNLTSGPRDLTDLPISGLLSPFITVKHGERTNHDTVLGRVLRGVHTEINGMRRASLRAVSIMGDTLVCEENGPPDHFLRLSLGAFLEKPRDLEKKHMEAKTRHTLASS